MDGHKIFALFSLNGVFVGEGVGVAIDVTVGASLVGSRVGGVLFAMELVLSFPTGVLDDTMLVSNEQFDTVIKIRKAMARTVDLRSLKVYFIRLFHPNVIREPVGKILNLFQWMSQHRF